MKIKCKKLNGVEKNICTCEQKIAYNYAFSWRDCYLRITKGATGVQKAEALDDIIEFIINDMKSRDCMKKYNVDAVVIAFRQGFLNYCEKFFIACSYETIGYTFKIPYEII